MSSGPSHILVLSQAEGSANLVQAWREFIGPADIEEARREKPERLVTRGMIKNMTLCKVIIPGSFIYLLNFYSYTVDCSSVTQSDREEKNSNKQHILACLHQTHPSIMPLSGRAPAE